jgi:aminoglycoside phosphotransferase family enzyme/predicted kinase
MTASPPLDCAKSDPAPGAASDASDSVAVQARLVSALRDAARMQAPGDRVRVLETHISYVLLIGQFAYKIKKAVSTGFLDYRSLQDRRFYCAEELRLNRRLAPALYLDVVAITGSVAAPAIAGEGAAIEYAVRMRAFPQEALATRVLSRGQLTYRHVDALAAQVAAFHGAAEVAKPDGPFGTPGAILRLALQNFSHIRSLLDDREDCSAVDALESWTLEQHARCARAMARRKELGFIRECHGDLHLANIAIFEGQPVIFDCIEFNAEMRWIDMMNEIAFTVMDLEGHGRPDFARRFLNAYLEIGGDYDGLGVLRFYLVYRAMVRAKVACMRAGQLRSGAGYAAARTEYFRCVRLAGSLTQPSRPAIIITHGFAGSGKTTRTQALLESIAAVRVRTDVERKRIHGLGPTARNADRIDAGLYAPAATRRTYRRARMLATRVAEAGYVAIVDGAFLKRWQRRLFRELAAKLRIPFVVVAFVATEATLRERIARRLHEGNDASDADFGVLEQQLRTHEPLTVDELAESVVIDTAATPDQAPSSAPWREVLERLSGAHRDTLSASRAQASPGPMS